MKDEIDKYKQTVNHLGFIIPLILAIIVFIMSYAVGINAKTLLIAGAIFIPVGLGLNRLLTRQLRRRKKVNRTSFPDNWKDVLIKNVQFYKGLVAEDQIKFQKEVQLFIEEKRITGVDTEITDEIRVLVAASAVIPVFAFPNWEYHDLDEVMVYSGAFNNKYETGKGGTILGMVGTGYMNNKMLLSKNAITTGFKNKTDKKNTAIHEFVHLIDKADGIIDGIPEAIMDKAYILPWLDMMKGKIDKVQKNKTDINQYGGTNSAEFLSVVSEYFFERPALLEKKHPELFRILQHTFEINTKQILRKALKQK